MKNILEFDLKFLIIVILSAILLFEKCGNEKDGETVNIDGKNYKLLLHKIDTFEVYKTKTETVKGDDIFHENYSVDTAYIKQLGEIDTAAIILDYFSKNVYKDTLRFNDSLGYVYIIDTITKNKILNRTWASSIKERLVHETTIVKDPPKVEYYLGLYGNFDKKDYLNSIGGSAIIKNTKRNMYQLNFGLTNKPYTTTQQFTPYIGGGVYWKIGK